MPKSPKFAVSPFRDAATARLFEAAAKSMEVLESRQMMSVTPITPTDTAQPAATQSIHVSLQHAVTTQINSTTQDMGVLGASDQSGQTAEQRRATRIAEREAKQAARIAAREARKQERLAAKAEREAARAARKAERLALRAARQAVNAAPASTPTSEAIPAISSTPVASATPAPAPVVTNDSNNHAPTVSLVNTGITTYAGPAHMVLRANAADSDGKVTRVDFYAGDTFIGTAGGAPWMVAWTDVQPGTYNVTAKAFDDDGVATVSSPFTVNVIAAPAGRTINVKPGESVSSAVRSAQAGDTVLIQPGTYKDTLTLRNSGTADRPITIKAAGPVGSVIIDGGTNTRLVADQWVGTGYWTTIQGITFRNASNQPGQDNAAIKTTDGMRLIDVTVENVDGAGIGVFGENVVLIRTTAQNNGCTGIGGSRVKNGLLVDCVSHGNNTKHFSGSYEGGGGKFTRVDGLLVQGHTSFDNNGPGIWFDGDNINVTIRGGVFHDNHDLWNSDGSQKIGGRGIQLEISGVDSDGEGGIDREGPILIEDCLTYDNDNASVQVYATANVTIQNNTFINDYIDLKDKRPAPYMVRNLTITNNTLENAHIEGDKAVVTDYRNEDIIIDHNTYTGGGKIFRWDYKDVTSISAVRALGFEANGKTAA